MLKAYIHHYLNWRQGKVYKDGSLCFEYAAMHSVDILSASYKALDIAYPKFYKMDLLSRLGFLATEWLNPEIDKNEPFDTGIIFSTHQGCLEVDKAFNHSRETFASPALFVYTLPNIVLGEICIRNNIKGPQICLIEEGRSTGLLYENALNLLNRGRARNCIVGHIDATEKWLFADMAWVSDTANQGGVLLTPESLDSRFGQY